MCHNITNSTIYRFGHIEQGSQTTDLATFMGWGPQQKSELMTGSSCLWVCIHNRQMLMTRGKLLMHNHMSELHHVYSTSQQ